MTDHAHELRRHSRKIGHPAGDIPAVMRAAANHIDDLERLLREIEQQQPIGYISDDALRDLKAREPWAPPIFSTASERNHIPLYTGAKTERQSLNDT